MKILFFDWRLIVLFSINRGTYNLHRKTWKLLRLNPKKNDSSDFKNEKIPVITSGGAPNGHPKPNGQADHIREPPCTTKKKQILGPKLTPKWPPKWVDPFDFLPLFGCSGPNSVPNPPQTPILTTVWWFSNIFHYSQPSFQTRFCNITNEYLWTVIFHIKLLGTTYKPFLPFPFSSSFSFSFSFTFCFCKYFPFSLSSSMWRQHLLYFKTILWHLWLNNIPATCVSIPFSSPSPFWRSCPSPVSLWEVSRRLSMVTSDFFRPHHMVFLDNSCPNIGNRSPRTCIDVDTNHQSSLTAF